MRRALVAAALILAGCGGSKSPSTTRSSTAVTTTSNVTLASGFHLSSAAFRAGGPIPPAYTCDGRDAPLPLRWTGVPGGAKELVLVMRDPDAPGGNFTHWTVKRIPVTTDALAAGSVPSGAVEGRNSFGTIGYRGPCPPHGDPPHHYVLTLSALSANALHAAPLATGTLTGTYGRH